MKVGRIAILAAVVTLAASVQAAGPRPSILFCSPVGVQGNGYVGLEYLNELYAQGFDVDYTESLADVTWARIANYNAVVLYMTPETAQYIAQTPPPAPGVNEAFTNAIEQYLAQGGGVFLFPMEMNWQKPAVEDFTDSWGAHLPIETIVETNSANKAVLDHVPAVPLAWTDQVKPSPVSAGVSELWYPTQLHYNAADGGPVDVDTNWTVVATASGTARSQPINLSITGFVPPTNPYQRLPNGVASPALMAVRDYKAGRVALLNQWPQYTIGSGRKWIFDSQVMSRGAGSKPRSDWAVLLTNTYAWLAAPSVANHQVGGYTTTVARLQSPNLQESVVQQFRFTTPWDSLLAQWQALPQYAAPYRGLIGAKTAYSSGTGTVAEYAAAAKAAGLQFVVFLDDFAQLTSNKLNQLKQDCAANSDNQISLVPGFTIDANTMADHMFFFGPDPVWPPTNVLTADKTMLNLQPQDANGQYTGYNGDSFNWMIYDWIGSGNHGYYNFTNSKAMRIKDLRVYAMAAVRYYKNGVLVDDATSNYLTCAQSTSVPTPVSFNEVRSPAELTSEAQSGNALTYVVANSVSTIMSQGLRWDNQGNTFPSDGPLIHAWVGGGGAYTLGAEEFVTAAALMPSRLEVSATNGLKEIAIYNGQDLYRRLKFSGETNFSATLMLGGFVQKDLVVVATDQHDGKAVSFARRCAKWTGRQISFCGDHVNDCKSDGALLAHGPYPMLAHYSPGLAADEAGGTWDGGPYGILPLITYSLGTAPLLNSSAGTEDGGRFSQTSLLEFTDEGAVAVATERQQLFDTNVLNVLNCWNTFGPLDGPSKLFDFTLRYREYVRPTVSVPETGWAGFPVNAGINAGLFRSEIAFKTNCTVNQLDWLMFGGAKPTSLPSMYFAYRQAPGGVNVIDISSGTVDTNLSLAPGDWFAVYGGGPGANSHIFIVREQPALLRLLLSGPTFLRIFLNAPIQGSAVNTGDTQTQELFSLGVPVDVTVTNVAAVTNLLAYLSDPEGMQVVRGTRTSSPGFVECAPDNGAIEIRVPRPAVTNNLTLPLRVSGLNRRWTAGLWQKDGYVRGFYGSETNRYREVGLDVYGYAYVPMYVNLATQTWMVVGHPVVADAAGSNVFIQVTKLWDDPPRWHVSVNNPTDGTVTTTLSQAMAGLPGLSFPATQVILTPGEYRVLLPSPLTVDLTSPSNGAAYAVSSMIPLTALPGLLGGAFGAGDGGAVTQVVFYTNGTAVGASATSPFTYNWTPGAAGSYSLTAVAYDNQGGMTTSSVPVLISADANYYWDGGGGGDPSWSTAPNWDRNAEPAAIGSASIGSSYAADAAAVVRQSGEACYSLALGDGTGTRGTLVVTNGGGLAVVGNASGGALRVGQSGTGAVSQSAGTVVADNLFVGQNSSSTGLYEMAGGTLTCTNEYIGNAGQGAFRQTGGTNAMMTYLFLGVSTGASGDYELTDGWLNRLSYGFIGYNGTGKFHQSGGTHAGGSGLLIGYSSTASGSYELTGGLCSNVSLTIGSGGPGFFTQTGGTNVVGSGVLTIGSGVPGDYRLAAGTLQLAYFANFIGSGGGTGTLYLGTNTTTGTITVPAGGTRYLFVRGDDASAGTLRGWGTLSVSPFMMNGRVVADGCGTDHTLDLSGSGFPWGIKDASFTYTSAHGWFAENCGRLLMPGLAAFSGTGSACWGDSVASWSNTVTNQPLVNSVKFNYTSGAGSLTGGLLAADHGSVHAGVSRRTALAVWDFGGVTFSGCTLTIRYDDAKAASLGAPAGELKALQWVNGAWQNITGSVDTNARTITASAVSPLSQIAVNSPAVRGTILTTW